MTRDEVFNAVIGYFRENYPDDDFAEGSDLESSVFADSISLVEVISFLEETFGITLERKDLASFKTPGGIIDLVMRKTAA